MAKCLQFEDTPFDKSMMQIKNNNGLKIELRGTPALTFSHDEYCLFRTIYCLLQCRKSLEGFKRFPEIYFEKKTFMPYFMKSV